MSSLDEEWSNYLSENIQENYNKKEENIETNEDNIPECEPLYISTKTKVLFLNQTIDLNDIFWKIPILEYSTPQNGVIKKQMKFVSKCIEELDETKDKLKNEYYYTENIIKQIHNPDARRIKFKDERKITVGISKKDILNSRSRVKNAFYNCFAIILRFLYEDKFKEIHVKIFNTGKLEIPGILNIEILNIVKNMILSLLNKHISNIYFIESNENNNVLINSNFNCGFFLNRDKLHVIIKNKYGIDTSYDPCSYPGIKCKFYFNNNYGNDEKVQKGKISNEDKNLKMSELIDSKKYTEVSFMIFRTGSCLIIGNCSEDKLYFIYNFIKNILHAEYNTIFVENENQTSKTKQEKIKKKTINVN